MLTWDWTILEQYKLLADAERVVLKEQQIMADVQFPEDYLLTVFPFTQDVSETMCQLLWFRH